MCRRPAVILLHTFLWFHKDLGRYYLSCERDFHDFGTYYGLIEVSVKAACWRLMLAGGTCLLGTVK